MNEVDSQPRPLSEEPRIGDVWKEVDPRFKRYVCVVGRSDNFVRIFTCDGKGTRLKHRETASSIGRFNGKRGGYALHKRAGK